jgi:hypothetical protein
MGMQSLFHLFNSTVFNEPDPASPMGTQSLIHYSIYSIQRFSTNLPRRSQGQTVAYEQLLKSWQGE